MSLIDPAVVVATARDEAIRLALVPNWRSAFDSASPGTPLRVKRLDLTDVYYYIVPFLAGNRVTARLRMDAQTGKSAEGIGIDTSGDELPPYRTANQTHARIVSLLKAAAKKQHKTKTSVPAFAIDQDAVWKPCAQSFSAFLPFYLVTVAGVTRYARLDGKVFDALTYGAGL